MQQAVQLTLDQVARQLNLSEVIVKRLSQYFRIPQSYYQPQAGYPKLMLFHPQEVSLLAKIHQYVVAGIPLNQIRQTLIEKETPLPRTAPQTNDVESTVTLLTQAPMAEENCDLLEYEEDSGMKEHLAQATFKQYLHNTAPRKAPLKALVQTLKSPSQGVTKPPLPSAQTDVQAPIQQKTDSPAKPPASRNQPFQPLSPSQSWMTPDLKARALQLQQKMRSTPSR